MALAAACALFADPVKTYSHPMDPRLHPDDARRLVKPPDAKTFNNRLQFMALRSMSASGYKDALDRYVVRDRLGDIIWAHSGMIFNKNVREQAEELKRRGLYLFDLWGFVPGSGPGTPKYSSDSPKSESHLKRIPYSFAWRTNFLYHN